MSNVARTWESSTARDVGTFALIFIVFYIMAYYSVSNIPPSSIPVHHDDYANYSGSLMAQVWSWNRPLSTALIHYLTLINSDTLIWAVRLLTVSYIFLAWKIMANMMTPRGYWPATLLYAVCVCSTPIIAEYARYTGMVTHMLSGCLGLAAVLFLFSGHRTGSLMRISVSALLFILSTLSKEDFFLLYIFSFAYIVVFDKKPLQASQKIIIGVGVLISIGLIAAAKFLAESAFLGVADAQSTYYVNLSFLSVVKTVLTYVMGANHPAMILHGQLSTLLLIVACTLIATLAIIQRSLPRSAYVFAATFAVLGPYSVLPNHVNAYYEVIWLPFLVASIFFAIVDLARAFPEALASKYLPISALLIISVGYTVVDYPGRHSVANWYDSVGSHNAAVLSTLSEQRDAINTAGQVCIVGADQFSPWYMHNGNYLKAVLGLNSHWLIALPEDSPLRAGVKVGADQHGSNVSIIRVEDVNSGCLAIKLIGMN